MNNAQLVYYKFNYIVDEFIIHIKLKADFPNKMKGISYQMSLLIIQSFWIVQINSNINNTILNYPHVDSMNLENTEDAINCEASLIIKGKNLNYSQTSQIQMIVDKMFSLNIISSNQTTIISNFNQFKGIQSATVELLFSLRDNQKIYAKFASNSTQETYQGICKYIYIYLYL